jgi:hypothetical protein
MTGSGGTVRTLYKWTDVLRRPSTVHRAELHILLSDYMSFVSVTQVIKIWPSILLCFDGNNYATN